MKLRFWFCFVGGASRLKVQGAGFRTNHLLPSALSAPAPLAARPGKTVKVRHKTVKARLKTVNARHKTVKAIIWYK